MKVKKIVAGLMPRKIAVSVDNIKIPCYNGYVTGGIILSKEKNELAKTEQAEPVKLLELNIDKIVKEASGYKHQPLIGLENVMEMPNISNDFRMAALASYERLVMDQRERDERQNELRREWLERQMERQRELKEIRTNLRYEHLPELLKFGTSLALITGTVTAIAVVCGNGRVKRMQIGRKRLTA